MIGLEVIALICTRGGSVCILGNVSFQKSGEALAQAVQGGDMVTFLGDVKELWRCVTEGHVMVRMVGMCCGCTR